MTLLQGPRYTPPPVELRNVLGAWTGAKTRGGVSLAGGRVVLTPQYLVLTPWDMDETRAFLVKGLSKAGHPLIAQVDRLIAASKLLEPVAIPLDAIVSLQPLNTAGLLKPPTVRLQLQDGRHFDLGVLHSSTTPNFSSKNDLAMQDLMSRLQPLLGRQRGITRQAGPTP